MEEIIKNTVISTRVRLARNFKGYPFPSGLVKTQADILVKKVVSALGSGYRAYSINGLGEMESGTLMEKHLISKELLRSKFGSVIVSDDESVGVMVNEEDHVRIQVILRGCALDEAYDKADVIDDKISEKSAYAFSERLGYLTACPTNLGTGLRASIMMFLPALSMTDTLEKTIKQFGSNITVRGEYGEGSKADGFVYQISNARTLGLPEKEFCSLVYSAVIKLAEKEKQAREFIIKERTVEITDEIMRAYGIASNAYSLSEKELARLVALIKLGAYYGILKVARLNDLDDLVTAVKPYTLTATAPDGSVSDEVAKSVYRAKLVRETINSIVTK